MLRLSGKKPSTQRAFGKADRRKCKSTGSGREAASSAGGQKAGRETEADKVKLEMGRDQVRQGPGGDDEARRVKGLAESLSYSTGLSTLTQNYFTQHMLS